MAKRVFVVVIDSFGIGSAPDATQFGDQGANTALRISSQFPGIWPNLQKLGLGNISSILGTVLQGCEAVEQPLASFCALEEVSPGKDTTTGHWELAGLPLDYSFPVYPAEYPSFPEDLIQDFIEKTGIPGILGNKAASGTEIIMELGDEHLVTKKPILYTSADSVIQIACHEELYSIDQLYRMCKVLREMTLESGLGRVIARPFIGSSGNYARTKSRKDFSLPLPGKTILDELQSAGIRTVGVGKIGDIFTGQGLEVSYPDKGNPDCLARTTELIHESAERESFVFVNLVDTDMIYGHRRDVEGYGQAVAVIDKRIGDWMEILSSEDLLVLTADHGCDPGFKGSDHTREYVPLLIYGKNQQAKDLGIVKGFYNLAKSIGAYFGLQTSLPGKNLMNL